MCIRDRQLSPYTFARMLESFGLKTPADPVVSLALGPNDASVYEMVGAYSSFVNKGIRVEPLLVTRIEDSTGKEVATFVPNTREVFSENSSYKMLDMLTAVVAVSYTHLDVYKRQTSTLVSLQTYCRYPTTTVVLPQACLPISDRKVCGLYILISGSASNNCRHQIVHYFFVLLSYR